MGSIKIRREKIKLSFVPSKNIIYVHEKETEVFAEMDKLIDPFATAAQPTLINTRNNENKLSIELKEKDNNYKPKESRWKIVMSINAEINHQKKEKQQN